MGDADTLKGKRILIVDDEPDVLETLEELLDMCLVDTASDFDAAKKCLSQRAYDAAVLDIMGVKGYELLEIANLHNIPALMLTAHALSPDNLVKSIKAGARAYLPKVKMVEIDTYLAELIQDHLGGVKKSRTWFARLLPFFDKKFDAGWKEKDKDFWREFDNPLTVTRQELEDIL